MFQGIKLQKPSTEFQTEISRNMITSLLYLGVSYSSPLLNMHLYLNKLLATMPPPHVMYRSRMYVGNKTAI